MQAMETALAKDEALRQAVEDFPIAQLIAQSIIEDEVRRVMAENNIDTIGNEEARRGKSGPWIIIITLLAALAVSYYQWNRHSNQERIWAEAYSEPNWPIQRNSVTDDISTSISQYFNGDQQTAKNTLAQLNTNRSNQWLAELYLLENKPDSCLLVIPNIETDRNSYLKILSTYRLNSISEAKKLVSELPPNLDSYYIQKYKTLGLLDGPATSENEY